MVLLRFDKAISIFYHNHLERLTATFPLVDSVLLIARSIAKSIIRSKSEADLEKIMALASILKRANFRIAILFLALSQ